MGKRKQNTKKDDKQIQGSTLELFIACVNEGFYQIYSKTKTSNFYRCIYCRKSTVRFQMKENSYFFTNGHPKNCRFRKEVKKIQKEIPEFDLQQSVSNLIGSMDQLEFFMDEIKHRNMDIEEI